MGTFHQHWILWSIFIVIESLFNGWSLLCLVAFIATINDDEEHVLSTSSACASHYDSPKYGSKYGSQR